MALTSERAAAMNQWPRMTEADVERAIGLFAAGCTAEEVHQQMPEWSAGTFANRKVGWKDRIAAVQRAKTVELDHIPMARQEARLDGYSDAFMSAWLLYRAQVRQCWIPNPNTGELEHMGTLEGGRLLKIYADVMHRMGRLIGEERGQLRPVLEKDPGKVTYEIPGVDLAAVAKDWAQQPDAPVSDSEFEPPPVTAPGGPMPEEFMGKDERQQTGRQRWIRADDLRPASSSQP
jgi:hypothetical protein